MNNQKEINSVDDNEEEIRKAVTNEPFILETNGPVTDESDEITEEIKVEGRGDVQNSFLFNFSLKI